MNNITISHIFNIKLANFKFIIKVIKSGITDRLKLIMAITILMV